MTKIMTRKDISLKSGKCPPAAASGRAAAETRLAAAMTAASWSRTAKTGWRGSTRRTIRRTKHVSQAAVPRCGSHVTACTHGKVSVAPAAPTESTIRLSFGIICTL